MNIKKYLTETAAAALGLSFALAGCGNTAGDTTASASGAEAQPAAAVQSEPSAYDLYYQSQDYGLSLYEPENGCYLGSYVLSDRGINFDAEAFDKDTGKEHTLSVYNLTAGNAFPDTWVFSCVAKMKTPYFVLSPMNSYNPYDKSVIDDLAASFGEYYVPMFVEFYPAPDDSADPTDYIQFFRYAREKFREKASNVAFVWAVDGDGAVDSSRYYPGDDYVDWVGLRLQEPLSGNGYGADVFNAINYMYYTYQAKKPLAITELAVSHYTTADHVYRDQAAAAELERVYGTIAKDYPRIKLINYYDFDQPAQADNTGQSDSFTVIGDDTVCNAYKSAIAAPSFLSELNASSGGNTVNQLMRSPFPVYKFGTDWYASADSFQYELHTKGLVGERDVDGEAYYDLNAYAKNMDGKLQADDANKTLTLTYNG